MSTNTDPFDALLKMDLELLEEHGAMLDSLVDAAVNEEEELIGMLDDLEAQIYGEPL